MPSFHSHTAQNAIVLAVEKSPPSPLVDTTGLEKLAIVCPNIGMVYSGMGPDFRVLVARARKSAQAYWKIYGEYPPTRVMVQELAAIMQEATQRGCVCVARACEQFTIRIYTELFLFPIPTREQRSSSIRSITTSSRV